MRSLRVQLLVTLMVVVVGALITATLYGSSGTSAEFQDYVAVESARRARAVAELLVYYRQNENWNDVQPTLARLSTIMGDRLVLTDEEGRVLGDSAEPQIKDEQLQRLINRLEGQLVDLELGRPSAQITSSTNPRVYLYMIPADGEVNTEGRFLDAVNQRLLVSMLAAIAVGFVLIILFSRNLLSRIAVLTSAARSMGQGDLSQRLDVKSQDEIGELAAAFNTMADGLVRQEQLRRNMVSDVAHELRTPLSNIRGYLEAMRDGVMEPTPALISSLHDEALILNYLVYDLQELALIEAGQMRLMQQPTAIEETLIRTVEMIRPQAADKDLAFVIDLEQDLPLVEADQERIGQVLRNLLSNAIHYSLPGGQITVSAREYGSMVKVIVQDAGVGIDPKHLPHIFDRFFRADQSRARSTGGAGLGLAITRQIVEAHGGEVWVESVLNHGTKVSFTIPVSEQQLTDFV